MIRPYRTDRQGNPKSNGDYIRIADRAGRSIIFDIADAHDVRQGIWAALLGPAQPCIGPMVVPEAA